MTADLGGDTALSQHPVSRRPVTFRLRTALRIGASRNSCRESAPRHHLSPLCLLEDYRHPPALFIYSPAKHTTPSPAPLARRPAPRRTARARQTSEPSATGRYRFRHLSAILRSAAYRPAISPVSIYISL